MLALSTTSQSQSEISSFSMGGEGIKEEILKLIEAYEADRQKMQDISFFMRDKNSVVDHFLIGNTGSSARWHLDSLFDLTKAFQSLDASYWKKALDLTGVMEILPAKKRMAWQEDIEKLKVPPFTKDFIYSTLGDLYYHAEEYFSDRIDGIFKSLSPHHKSNSSHGFREKMIISYFLSSFGKDHLSPSHNAMEIFEDLRKVIAIVDNRGDKKGASFGSYSLIDYLISNNKFNEWIEIDHESIRLKIFKNRNAHIEISQDVADRLNYYLAKRYPLSLGHSISQNKKSKQYGNPSKYDGAGHSKQFLSSSLRRDILQILESINEDNSINKYVDKDMHDLLLDLGGKLDSPSNYSFTFDIKKVLETIYMRGVMPDKKEMDFYETPDFLINRMLENIDLSEIKSILEPSCGNGAIISHLSLKSSKDTLIHGIEWNHLRFIASKSKFTSFPNIEITEADFFKAALNKKYDLTIMNPPFSNGKAKKFVENALSMTSKKLVAILPASYKNHDFTSSLYPHARVKYSEIISNAFKSLNTGVSVVLLEISLSD